MACHVEGVKDCVRAPQPQRARCRVQCTEPYEGNGAGSVSTATCFRRKMHNRALQKLDWTMAESIEGAALASVRTVHSETSADAELEKAVWGSSGEDKRGEGWNLADWESVGGRCD